MFISSPPQCLHCPPPRCRDAAVPHCWRGSWLWLLSTPAGREEDGNWGGRAEAAAGAQRNTFWFCKDTHDPTVLRLLPWYRRALQTSL